jgi:hypothetical protein
MEAKLKSVNELARYQVGDVCYWVVLRQLGTPSESPTPENVWMAEEHPKCFFDRRVFSPMWKSRMRIPKLHATDFRLVTDLLTQRCVIEEFHVTEIKRSHNTGEFWYTSSKEEMQVESFLFSSRSQVVREKRRIKKMIIEWIERYL